VYKLKAKVDILDSATWQHYFDIPQNISDNLVANNQQRVCCTIDEDVEFQCALTPKGWVK
jgi:hypothetical protein